MLYSFHNSRKIIVWARLTVRVVPQYYNKHKCTWSHPCGCSQRLLDTSARNTTWISKSWYPECFSFVVPRQGLVVPKECPRFQKILSQWPWNRDPPGSLPRNPDRTINKQTKATTINLQGLPRQVGTNHHTYNRRISKPRESPRYHKPSLTNLWVRASRDSARNTNFAAQRSFPPCEGYSKSNTSQKWVLLLVYEGAH